MAKKSNKKIEDGLIREIILELLKEVKEINSNSDLENFLGKILTISEKQLVFRRLAAVELIKQGEKYRRIKELLDISSGTISKAVDAFNGRGYGNNPNRKRKYSLWPEKKKRRKPLLGRYKGAESII